MFLEGGDVRSKTVSNLVFVSCSCSWIFWWMGSVRLENLDRGLLDVVLSLFVELAVFGGQQEGQPMQMRLKPSVVLRNCCDRMPS